MKNISVCYQRYTTLTTVGDPCYKKLVRFCDISQELKCFICFYIASGFFQILLVPSDEAQECMSGFCEEEKNAVPAKSNSFDTPGDFSFLSPLTPSTLPEREVCSAH